jgi:SAM-dependent methyltransferase
MPWWTLVLVAAVLGVLAYWLIVLTEGTYLGSDVVIAIYERFARRYDDVKRFDDAYEALFLGRPLAQVLAECAGDSGAPVVLDVATGTGRLPLALLRATSGQAHVVVLDGSLEMLRCARAKLASYTSVIFVRHDAARLPFVDDAFDAVACLEALEFMPRPKAVLAELLRVLQPGGALWITNRVGWQARLMPGKTFSTQGLVALLESSGAVAVRRQPWQVDYDLVTARKKGAASRTSQGLSSLLRCPSNHDRSTLDDLQGSRVQCSQCGWQLQWQDGIWQ